MIGIVLAGHGSLADGLRDGAEMIMGPQQQLSVVDLRPAENLDVYRERLQHAVEQVDSGKGALIIVDLFGGSPCNVSAYLLGGTVEVVAGASLPMLIEVLSARDDTNLEELVKTALSAGQQGLIRLADQLRGGAAV